MPFSVKYSKSRRMIISGLCCDCQFEHRSITQDIYIGNGVLEGLAAMIKRRDMGKRLVLVADGNTYAAAGEKTARLLSQSGYTVTPLVLDEIAIANEQYIGQTLLAMRMDTDFFVSVGSGSVTDITRIVASRTERPMAVVATAASTTAYPSLVSKAASKGFISTIRTVSPEIVLCDMDIIRRAPARTVAAGFAEIMSKYLSVADWRLGRLINCEKLCPTYAAALLFAANQTLEAVEDIAARSDKGLQTLVESLVISGLIVELTASSRAIESVEHAAADYCVMDSLKKGNNPPAYQDALSMSIARCLDWIDRLKTLDKAQVDNARLREFDFEREVIKGFGDDAERVAALWPDASKESLIRQMDAFVKRFASIKNALGDIPEGRIVLEAMKRVGCMQDQIGDEVANRACRYAPWFTGACSLPGLGRFLDDAKLTP